MAFEIHNAPTIGIALIVVELLFWLFVCYRLVKYGKSRKSKWKSPFKSQQ